MRYICNLFVIMIKTTYIKWIFYIVFILMTIILNCKRTTDPEIISGTYIIIECYGMSVEEYTKIHGRAPIISELKLTNYRAGSSDYHANIFIRDIGWTDTERNTYTTSESFIINTRGLLGKIEYIWFSKLKISKNTIEGIFETCGAEIEPLPIQFKTTRK